MTNRGLIMTVSGVSQGQRIRTTNGSSVDIDKVRSLIAKHLDVDIRRVTDDADLSHDLGADWLDRIELIILFEEIAGVEIADHEANRIEVVGDLILYVDEGAERHPISYSSSRRQPYLLRPTLQPRVESHADSGCG
jgi:acyl carrier protein